MTLRDLLKRLRAEKEITTYELAEAAGCSHGYIAQLENVPGKKISRSVAAAICEKYGLLPHHFAEHYSKSSGKTAGTVALYPLFGEVGAGPPVNNPTAGTNYISIPKLCDGADGLYLVNGTSMVGAGILPGDLLAVKRNPAPENGDLAVAYLAKYDGTVVKKVRKQGKKYTLHSVSDEEDSEKRYPHTMGNGDVFYGVMLSLHRGYKTT